VVESIPAGAEFADSSFGDHPEQVLAAGGAVLTLVHESDASKPAILTDKQLLKIPAGETISTLDIVEHLERCGAQRSVVAFVSRAMDVRAPYLSELRKEEWDIAALTDEEFETLVGTIPEIMVETQALLSESGLSAHWQKNGKGPKVAYTLLLGNAADEAMAAGNNGDWQEVAKTAPKPKRPKRGVVTSLEDEDFLGMYLQEIGRTKLLTKEDEVDLAQKIEAGRAAQAKLDEARLSKKEQRVLQEAVELGNESWKMFVDANLRLVVSIAKGYQGSGAPLLDLVQMGSLGLMHAVDKFEWRKGFKFSTYATNWIRQSIQRELANTNREIRLPVHANDNLKRVKQVWREFKLEHNRTPSVTELSDGTYLPVDNVNEVLPYIHDTVSLQDKINEDQKTERGDLVEDKAAHIVIDEILADTARRQVVGDMLALLDDQSRQLLELKWGLDGGGERTYAEIGTIVDLDAADVKFAVSRAMDMLRHPTVQSQFDIRSILS
jgi:RNA polymerase sigma factor (sigma-70 family)